MFKYVCACVRMCVCVCVCVCVWEGVQRGLGGSGKMEEEVKAK